MDFGTMGGSSSGGGSNTSGAPGTSAADQLVQQTKACNKQAAAAAAPRWKKATTPPDLGDLVGGGIISVASKLLKVSNPIAIGLGFASVFKNQIGSAVIAGFQYYSTATGCYAEQGITNPNFPQP